MRTAVPGVDWLLDCEPRPAQLEALARSYTGMTYRDHKDHDPMPSPLAHRGAPAKGWGHFLEMRVGKTPTYLNEFLLFRRDHGIRKSFMLAPNKYKHAWALEAKRFGILDVPLFVYEGGKKGQREFLKFMEHPEGMVFVNYEALVSQDNCALFEQFIDDRTLMGADESVMLKNRQSIFFKRAFELSKVAAATRPMTGKPTPQGVQDLYSQLRFARGLEGWNFFQFRNKFAEVGGFKGKQITGVKDEERLARLRHQLSFFARRADWGTTIAPDFEEVEVGMAEVQQDAYKSMEEEFIVWLDGGDTVTADQIITKHMKLQQISSGFIIDGERQIRWLMPPQETPKFLDLVDRLTNRTTDKVILIFNYKATGDALIEGLKAFKPAVIRGQEYMKKFGLDVEAEKRRFNSDPKCRVVIGQSKAIKFGHTLMGSPDDPCLTTIYYENNYSLDDRSQTEQRNQGEGQQGAINIVDYYSSPAERKVIEALQRKEEVASKIMGYYRGELADLQ